MASSIAAVPLGTIWTDSANLPCPVNTEYDDGLGNVYVFVKFLDAVTYAAGQVCTYAVSTGGSVTNDISGGSSIGSIVRGICLAAQTQNSWGWVQRKGRYATVKTSGADDIAIGESLIVHASTDGTCDGVAAGSTTTASFGIAATADVDADNTVAAILNCP